MKDDVEISFEASITLQIPRSVYDEMLAEQAEYDEDADAEDAVLEELRNDMEGEDIRSLYGHAFLAFVDEGTVL